MGQGGARRDDDPKASASRRQGGLSGGWREEPAWRDVKAELGEALLGGLAGEWMAMMRRRHLEKTVQEAINEVNQWRKATDT